MSCSNSTFLLATYGYAGLLNHLIPSGKSGWAVTEYLLLAAKPVLGGRKQGVYGIFPERYVDRYDSILLGTCAAFLRQA